MKNFLLDFATQEKFLRSDISRFGKVDTFKRVWDDFGGLNEDNLPSLSYNNVELVHLGGNRVKIITWPKTICFGEVNQPPDKIEFQDISSHPLIKELWVYLRRTY